MSGADPAATVHGTSAAPRAASEPAPVPLALACAPWALAGAVAFGAAPAALALVAQDDGAAIVALGACELGAATGVSARIATELGTRGRPRLALLARAVPAPAALAIGLQAAWLLELATRGDPASALAGLTASVLGQSWVGHAELAAALLGVGLGASALGALGEAIGAAWPGPPLPGERLGRALGRAFWTGLFALALGATLGGAGAVLSYAALSYAALSAVTPHGLARICAAPFAALAVAGGTLAAASPLVAPLLSVGFELAPAAEARLRAGDAGSAAGGRS